MLPGTCCTEHCVSCIDKGLVDIAKRDVLPSNIRLVQSGKWLGAYAQGLIACERPYDSIYTVLLAAFAPVCLSTHVHCGASDCGDIAAFGQTWCCP
jgi:hypothetical protein